MNWPSIGASFTCVPYGEAVSPRLAAGAWNPPCELQPGAPTPRSARWAGRLTGYQPSCIEPWSSLRVAPRIGFDRGNRATGGMTATPYEQTSIRKEIGFVSAQFLFLPHVPVAADR